ncbi:hypothetical protein GCM10027168_01440 [Streptomyces capparidis]
MAPSSRTLPHQSAPVPSSAGGLAAREQIGLDAGLLVLRVAVGLTIAAHGSQKLFGWFDGPGLDGTDQFFTMLGYPSGRTMAVIAGLSELLGGLGLALGLLTPLAGAAVLGTMLNVLWIERDNGWIGGVEFPLLIAAGAAGLALTGPGRWAADRMIPALRTPRPLYGAALALAVVAAAITLLMRG